VIILIRCGRSGWFGGSDRTFSTRSSRTRDFVRVRNSIISSHGPGLRPEDGRGFLQRVQSPAWLICHNSRSALAAAMPSSNTVTHNRKCVSTGRHRHALGPHLAHAASHDPPCQQAYDPVSFLLDDHSHEAADLEEALDGLEESLGPEFAEMKRGLALIVRAIYTQKRMSAASPDEVGAAFEKACNRFEGRGQ